MVSRTVIFVFLDGVGLGVADESNPLWSADMPVLRRLLGEPWVEGVSVKRDGDRPLFCRGIDATLGVPGLPQSGTGQTSLFTGINAAQVAGKHIFAFPTTQLRQLIAEHSLLKRAVAQGLRATLANAYSDGYWEWVQERRRGRHSVVTLTNMAAGLPFRNLDDLREGRAVYWDITHEVTRARSHMDLEKISAFEAGRRLARLGRTYHLVVYETFLTDLAGHRRLSTLKLADSAGGPVAWTLQQVDGLLGGVLEALPPGGTAVVCSDHGNIEDRTFKGHTLNPVPLLVVGAGAAAPVWDQVRAIYDVPQAILSWLVA